MAKKPRDTGNANCVCSVCGVKANTPPNKKHRRCSGNNGSSSKEKGADKLPSQNRGTWEVG